MLKHEQVFCVDPESEISTTADDCTLEEEEFGVVDSYSEQGAHYSETHLELIENELVGKPEHEPEELNRELEEMRTTCGNEGLHQLQEFEAAVKQRDSIITQLTANLQQARRERDKMLQASETLRNSTHSNTAADLLQAKQQILTHQQQVEEQDHLLEDYQKKKEDFKMQINFLQEKIKVYEMEQDEEKSNKKELQEKEAIIQALNIRIIEEEKKNLELKDQVTATEKLMRELQEQIASMKLELANSKQKERQCSEEIKQLMGTVEDLQKRHYYIDSQFKSDVVQKMVEQEMQKRLEQLRAEMDEMYGQQIVQMKQELIKQHMSQIEELKTQHKEEIECVLKSHLNITINEDQIKLTNVAINELNMKLQDANAQKEKLQEELGIISGEKSTLQRQLDDLFEELNFLRDQIQRARMIIAEQESQLNEARKSLSTVEALKAEIVLASESRKELELKHEAKVTNYKIKLEMLEKEKNAVLVRMAESQEAELERLRTQLLFSHEDELSKLKDDLEVEHQINIEKLEDSLGIHYKQQIDGLQNLMSQKMETMQFEKDNLITKQNQLVLEISKLQDLQKSIMDSKSEEMTLQMHELQEEIEILRQEKKEKGTLELEVQELQLKIELLEKQIKEKEDDLKEKFSQLEAENNILKNEKKAFEDMLKIYVPADETYTQKIKQLEEQIQELENFICFLRKQLKEIEENHKAEIYSLQEKLKAISETTVDPSFSVDSVVIKESDVQKSVVHPGSCLKKNIDHAIEFSKECGMKQETNMVKFLEKQYQERLEEEIAKVIVSMSVAFAQQTELSRLSKGKENTMSSKQALTFCQQNEKHYFNEMKLSQDQIDLQTSDALDMKFKEEFKPLSKELGEDGEVLLPNSDHLDDIIESEVHQLTISEEMFSKDKTFIVSESIHGKMLTSSMDASRQMMSNEEQLEDMRQELVRQYEEHQQATELLRQAHMRHMEQLQEEIKRLNRQLAQRSSLNNENLVSERERVILEELEALKKLSLAGREKLCCELRSSSTQTQLQQEVKDWSASHAELSEQIKSFEKFQKDLLVALNHKDDTINMIVDFDTHHLYGSVVLRSTVSLKSPEVVGTIN
ncbi:A-kinase anchor protein 9-like [Callospermophilus lateralis]|uniref:A-kinase anchor protein 9-like n=1 Tax=Callospermophilus lateralis TaxID=76772 RepID=UPI0040540B16